MVPSKIHYSSEYIKAEFNDNRSVEFLKDKFNGDHSYYRECVDKVRITQVTKGRRTLWVALDNRRLYALRTSCLSNRKQPFVCLTQLTENRHDRKHSSWKGKSRKGEGLTNSYQTKPLRARNAPTQSDLSSVESDCSSTSSTKEFLIPEACYSDLFHPSLEDVSEFNFLSDNRIDSCEVVELINQNWKNSKPDLDQVLNLEFIDIIATDKDSDQKSFNDHNRNSEISKSERFAKSESKSEIQNTQDHHESIHKQSQDYQTISEENEYIYDDNECYNHENNRERRCVKYSLDRSSLTDLSFDEIAYLLKEDDHDNQLHYPNNQMNNAHFNLKYQYNSSKIQVFKSLKSKLSDEKEVYQLNDTNYEYTQKPHSRLQSTLNQRLVGLYDSSVYWLRSIIKTFTLQ